MSAPNTNVERQAEKHAGPLSGMALGLIFAGVLLAGLIGWTVYQGGEPAGADAQIDGRTGAVVTTD